MSILDKIPKVYYKQCINCNKFRKCFNLSYNNTTIKCNHFICLACYETVYKNKDNSNCYICTQFEDIQIYIYLSIIAFILCILYPFLIWYIIYFCSIWICCIWLDLFYY